MDEGLTIYTLGGLRILRDGQPVNGFGTHKAEALLVYLACTGRPHPREALADFLWDERSQNQALGNLRVVLNRLRQQLGDYLMITRDAIGLKSTAPVRLDVADLEASLRSAQDDGLIQSEMSASQTGQAIMQMYQGEFLDGFTVFDCRQFEDWVTRERERLHYLVADRLNELVAYELENGNYKSGLEHASRLLSLDPLMETAHRQMMLLLAYSGQRSAALEQYKSCRKILAAELQVNPSPETTQLYESIRDGTLEIGKWVVPSPVKEPPAPGPCPYKGLQYFDEVDAPLFFGRDALVTHLVERLLPPDGNEPLSTNLNPRRRFLAVIGASGSGKSSVVRAGLVPAIRRLDWDIHIITPTAHPLEALSLLPGPISGAKSGDGRYLLVVDQFEELFSLCRDEMERKAFIDRLLSLVGTGWQGNLSLVIVLRADFYAACAPFENLRQALTQHQEYIGPMSAAELRLAIEEPARLGRWDLEAGLVELFLRDIGAGMEGQEPEPGALPLLSHALMETWLRRQGRTLTLAGYAEAGGVRGAVARTADSVYAQLSTLEQFLARNIFLRLTELGEGTQETRRRATLAELVPTVEPAIFPASADAQMVLKTLADARLVTTTAETVEVAHEALIREWGRLQDWLNEDREGLHLHRRLTEAAQEWERLRHDSGILYRGVRLAQALEWEVSHPSDSNALEREFLQASQAEAEREAAEREAQRQRELEAAQRLAEAERQRAEEQRQAAQRLRRRAVYLSLSLAAAFLLVLVAIAFAGQAGHQTRLATSRELASAALNNLEVDQERSMLLAMQAVKTADIHEAENALHQAVLASRLRDTLSGHSDPVYGIAFAPDRSPGLPRFATASQDGTIKIWELDETRLRVKTSPLVTISNPNDFQIWADGTGYSVALSPDGKQLAAIGSDHTAKIWDAASGRLLHTLSGHSGNVFGLAFSPDGELLATGSEDGTVKIWDTRTGRELHTLTGHTTPVSLAIFSPDGKHLASVDSFIGKVIVWDQVKKSTAPAAPGRFAQSFSIESQFDWVAAIAFSPDGRQLAIGYNDIKVYDITSASGTSPARLVLNIPAHENIMNGLVYSPDGRRLISGSGDGTAKVWDAETGQALFTLSGSAGPMTSIALSSDGESLLTAYHNSNVKVWDLSTKGNQEWMTIPEISIGFDTREGNRLVTTNTDPNQPKVLILEVSSHGVREISSINLKPGPFFYFDADQDLSRLVTLYENDYFVHVWDLTTGQKLRSFSIEKSPTDTGHTTKDFIAIKLSPDGTRLVTGGSDGTLILWDLETGRPLHTLIGHTDLFGSHDPLAFSPDGTRIATANYDGSLRIWDANSGALLHDLPGHSGPFPNVSFSPDGERLLATGEGSSINLWDVHTGQALLTLPESPTLVNNLGISPDNKYLAAATLDETVHLWDANTGQELLSLPGIFMRFTGDGKHLIAFKDNVGYGFTLDINELMMFARARLTRSWTPDECSKFLHNTTCPPTP